MLAFIFGFYGRIVGFMFSIEIYIEISWIYIYMFGIRFVISLQFGVAVLRTMMPFIDIYDEDSFKGRLWLILGRNLWPVLFKIDF